jgi:hypothetical protein
LWFTSALLFVASNFVLNMICYNSLHFAAVRGEFVSWHLDRYLLDKQTWGPVATLLTWVILANISHINTCKVTFLYCGPNCSKTMTLTTWFCIRSPYK